MTTNGKSMVRLGLAVASMRDHTTDEGWQIFSGLSNHGYTLCGHDLPIDETNIFLLLTKYDPDIVFINDKREWDVSPRDFRDPRARFTNTHTLRCHPCYKVTILKDAHQKPEYHRQAMVEMAIDAHIIYYDEEAVRKQAPWLNTPLIRTYHTLDKNLVPPYENRSGVAILSGALSNVYPLRQRLVRDIKYLPAGTSYIPHPGYHRRGCNTPEYLKTLSQYRVAICTCSIYEYALRKIVEATACGCVVITNLPAKYSLPGIDINLVRVDSDIPTPQVRDLIGVLYKNYDPTLQSLLASTAKELYDYRVVTKKLKEDIDALASKVCRT